jgi:hypothetical protein
MSAQTNEEIQINMVTKAWSDPTYKNELEKDPTGLCRREGMKFNGEITMGKGKIEENIFYLPPAPSATDAMSAIEVQEQASELIRSDKEMF